jgi:beta-N-acetylhexosaminidase
VTALSTQVGKLLWCGFDGHTPPPSFVDRARAGEIGAAIVFKRNLGDPAEILELNQALHGAGLLVAVDQEGGTVQRVREPATVWPPMRRLGETGDPDLAEAVGRALGAELAVLGFDIDFAPVLDVDTNPANPVIGARAFADTADDVIRMAGAFARGLTASGVLPCGKHFPGHGDTTVDSHLALPRIDHDLARLRAVELAPFRALIDLPLLMTAHVVFAALDAEQPATLSAAVVETLLRGELGYRGLVISDDLEMKAILDHYGVADAAERAVAAGCDALLVCSREDLQVEAHDGLVRAAERSAALRVRIDQAAARNAELVAAHPPRPRVSVEDALAVLGAPAHRALAERLTAGK